MSDAETIILSTLSQDAYVMANKKLLRFFKGDASATVFLGELISTYNYHKTRNLLEPDGSFPIPIRRMIKSIGFSAYKQERIAGKLTELSLCKVYLKGYPASKYAFLNFDEIYKILSFDDMLAKRLDREEFYSNLNIMLNSADPLTYNSLPGVLELDRQCDNMSMPLKGSIILLSKIYRDNFSKNNSVKWTTENTGKLTMWIRSKMTGRKKLDFSFFERACKQIPGGHLGMTFDQFVSQFIFKSKDIPDVHFSEQVYDYVDILLPQGD